MTAPGLGAGARFGASPCTRPTRPARREEPVRATGYGWAVSLHEGDLRTARWEDSTHVSVGPD